MHRLGLGRRGCGWRPTSGGGGVDRRCGGRATGRNRHTRRLRSRRWNRGSGGSTLRPRRRGRWRNCSRRDRTPRRRGPGHPDRHIRTPRFTPAACDARRLGLGSGANRCWSRSGSHKRLLRCNGLGRSVRRRAKVRLLHVIRLGQNGRLLGFTLILRQRPSPGRMTPAQTILNGEALFDRPYRLTEREIGLRDGNSV